MSCVGDTRNPVWRKEGYAIYHKLGTGKNTALELGISDPQKLISLSAMYHVYFDDEKIYPAGYFLKLL